MPLRVPAVVTGLEASIQAQAKKAGQNLKINLGTNAKSIEGLSQPLGRITGKADQFTKSMEAANARVLAFGASVGVLSAVTRGFKELVTATIEVEKRLTAINSILGVSSNELDRFKKTIFDVARNTEQSFDTVSQAALELSRQGLKAEEVVQRLNDAMILSRLSGQGAAEAVAGLTAAINSFEKGTVTSTEVVNKFSAAAKSAAVSERDLAEAIKRAGSVASIAGVSFDELVGVVSAVQQKTARGGAVIGNSFKTIFTRIQSLDKLQTLQNLGAQVTDAQGEILSATQLIRNLAGAIKDLPEARQLQIAEQLVGKFQVAPFVAILQDYNEEASTAIRLTEISQNAATDAYERNAALNKTLSAAINEATVNLKELSETLGKIGITDSLRNILGFFNKLVSGLQTILEGEGLGSDFARGIVKGIGNVISGPGLAIFGAIIAKLTIDLARFGVGSLQTFFGLNKAAKEQATLQGQIASTLLGNKGIQQQILAIENSTLSTEQKRAAQTKFFTTALNEQLRIMTQMQAIAGRIAPAVGRGTRGARGRAAEGFIPNFDAVRGYGSEQSAIRRGVGGAPPSARAVTIPNFNFGGGQRGTMVANTSEFIVPNFAGGGSAIFNQDMVSSMGLPAGAKKVGAAGGYIPNFAGFAFGTAGGTSMQRAAGVIGAGVGGRYGGRDVTKDDVDRATKFRAQNPTAQQAAAARRGQQGILTIPQGYRYGVAALFPSKKTDTTTASFVGETTNQGVLKLREKGFTGVSLQNVQISDLQTMQRKRKRGMKESENRKKIGRLFAEPLLRYGSELIGEVFSNDENRKIKRKIKSIRGGQGSKLFSTSVEGGIFESAISLVTKGAGAIQEFKTHQTEREPFDFEEGGRADTKFKRAFGFKDNLVRADAKRTASNKAVQTLIFKALNDPTERAYILRRATAQQKKGAGKGLKGAAGGYIPNFSISPLQDAIARETGAGVPINQVRVNQSSRLRNAGNPMGLAVTNMRDEPTGAIPNFAKGPDFGQNEVKRGFSDAMGKVLMFSMAIQMLGGVLGGLTQDNEAVAKSMKMLNIAVIAATVAMMLPKGGLGNILNLGMKGRMGGGLLTRGAARMEMGARMARGIGGAAWATKTPRPIAGNLMKLGGAATKGAGALLRFMGPVGLAAAGTMALYKGIQKYSGVTDLVIENQKQLARTTKDAAKELRELKVPTSVKEDLKERSRQGAANTMQTMRNLRHNRAIIGGHDNIVWGKDKQVLADLEAEIINLGDQGVASHIIQAEMKRAEDLKRERTGRTGSKWSATKDLRPLMQRLGNVGDRFNAQDIINRATGGLTLEQQAELQLMEENKALAASQGRKLTKEERAQRAAALQPITQISWDEGIDQATLLAGVLENIKNGTAEIAQVDRLRSDIAKIRLTTEIEVNKIKATAISKDKIALMIEKAKGEKSELQLLNLEKSIALADNRVKMESSIADLQKEAINNLEKLNFNHDEEKALKKVIMDMDLEQMATAKGRKKILDGIVGLDKLGVEEAKLLLQKFEEQVAALKRKGVAIDQNTLKEIEARREALKTTQALERRLKILDREASLRARARENRLEISELGTTVARGAIERNVGLTPLERERALFNILPQVQADQRQGFENRSLKEIDDLLKSIDQNKSGLNRFTDDLRKILADPELGKKGLGAVLKKLQEETAAERRRFPESMLLKGGYDKRNNAMLQIIDFFNQLGISLENFGLKLKAEGAAIEGGLNNFAKAPAILAHTVQELVKSTEDIRARAVMARSGGEFISGARSIRQNIRRGKVGDRDFAGQTAITEEFALLGLRDTARTGITRAERRQAERQIPLVEEQFKLQQRLNVLYQDADKNLEEIKRVENEILDIERKRKLVNEQIGAAIEDTFIKSAEDIERELGKTLLEDGLAFKRAITDGMVDAIALGTDLGDVLRDAATQFFSSRAKEQMAAAFDGLLSGLGGGLEGIPSRGERGGLLDVVGSAIGGLLNFNSGGLVSGGSGTRDDVPTLLQGGEFVIRKSAVARYGPEFLEALNRGGIQTMQRGGFFTPGTYGQESIIGSRNLLDFATQSHTSGQFDIIGGAAQRGGSLGFASLEPMSGRLTMFGRQNSPLFQREQDSQREAFGLYTRQAQLEQQLAEQREQRRKQFWSSLLAMVGTAAIGGIIDGFGNQGPVDHSLPQADPVTGQPTYRGRAIDFSSGPQSIDEGWRLLPQSGAGSVLTPRATAGVNFGGNNPFSRIGNTLSLHSQQIVDLNTDIQSIISRMLSPFMMDSRVMSEGGQGPDTSGVGGLVNPLPAWPGASVLPARENQFPFGPVQRAAGGYVSPAAGVDTVPTMLSGGEFVMNAGATQRIGRGGLAALNAGGGEGGGDEAIVARLDELIAVSEKGGESIINITINSDGTETQDNQGDDQDQQNLALRIRDVVRQTINEEKRLGGSLRMQ
jgi:TP901 family phage tail tape measure protein